MSFDDILKQIAKVSQGAALTAANSYSGSMDRLSVAANNASETIGQGLVQALTEVSSAGTFEGAITGIDKLSQKTSDFIVYLEREIQLIQALPSLLDLATGNFDAFKKFLKTYEKIKKLDNTMKPQKYGGAYGTKYEKEAAAAAAKQLAADKRAAAAKLAADKKAAADKKTLAKGNALFDLEQIGLQAALKMSIDKETRLRLELLQAIQIGDADLVLAKMKELSDWQKTSDMAKLSGITTISEKQLSALNATLLAELDAISKSKMSDAEKSAAQQAAWGRYNDAIKYAGGLAALSTYSQKLQDQELLIQRLASIQKISEAQTAADNIKQAALDKYLATLGQPVPVPKPPPGVTIVPPTVIGPPTLIPGGGDGAGGKSGGNLIKDLEKIVPILDIITNNGNGIPIDIPNSDFPNKRGLDLGQSGDTVLNFNAPITTTSTDEFARLVQKAIQNNNRFGNNLDYAGAI